MWGFDQGGRRGGERRSALDRGWERRRVVQWREDDWEAPGHVVGSHAALSLWADEAIARIVCWEGVVVDYGEIGIAPGHIVQRHAALSLGASEAAARICRERLVVDYGEIGIAPGHVVQRHAALSIWTDDAVAGILIKYPEWHGQDAERHGGNQKGVGSKGRHNCGDDVR